MVEFPAQKIFKENFLPPSSSGPGRGPLKAKTGVRFPLGAPTKTHSGLCTVEVEQFLEMIRFEQRKQLAELPGTPK
jgi:hypothetical protein